MAESGRTGLNAGVIDQPPTALDTRTILVVDDHAGFRRTVRDFLPEGAEVVECGDGADALQAYENHHPDWTLMDIDMPGMDGLTATRAIRAAHPQARIVIVTSHNTPDFRAEADEAGAAAFLRKDDLCGLVELLSKSQDPHSMP